MAKNSSKKKLNLRKDMNSANTITSNIYNLIIGIFISLGLLINIGMCKFIPENLVQNIFMTSILTLVLAIVGILIMSFSNNIILIVIGFSMMNIGIGLGLSSSMSYYKIEDILMAVVLTLIIVVAMTIISSIFPKFFLSIGKALFVSLVILIIVEFAFAFISGGIPSLVIIISVSIFSLFIGYDWQKSQNAPKTVKNAILSAGELYLDIINMFVDILELLDRK